MTDSAATTSEVTSASRKRPRKRQRKSKSTVEDGRIADGSDGQELIEPVNQQHKHTTGDTSLSAEASFPIQPSAASTSAGRIGQAAVPAILSSNPYKPSVLPRPSIHGARQYTLSVALPSSIVLNAQTMELKTRLIGSIARVCAVFNVDEIIVFSEGDERQQDQQQQQQHQNGSGDREAFDPDSFTAMILQYLETPQYLRKQLFPMHPNLRLAGLLPPLDCPHHLRFEEESPYREGIIVEEPQYTSQRVSEGTNTVWVNVGYREALQCRVGGGAQRATLPPSGTRVTVEMPKIGRGMGTLVSPRTPVQSAGLYWGYSVRLVSCLSEVFTSCPFISQGAGATATPTEYDLVIGTAERGDSLTDILYATQIGSAVPSSKLQGGTSSSQIQPLPANGFHHALLLFGGLAGLEVAIERDDGIPLGLEDARELCDHWIDVVEGQGSRTVRTEEAITITLARLKTIFEQLGRR